MEQQTRLRTSVRSDTAVDWHEVAYLLLCSRRIDELEEQQLLPAGKITYQFSAKGHELAQILLGLHLRHPHDGATVYYRSRPFMLSVGLTLAEAFAGPLGKATSPNGGRDIGVVFNLPPPTWGDRTACQRRRGSAVYPCSGLGTGDSVPRPGAPRQLLARCHHRCARRGWFACHQRLLGSLDHGNDAAIAPALLRGEQRLRHLCAFDASGSRRAYCTEPPLLPEPTPVGGRRNRP
jgi:hypothetical protein